MTKIKRKVVISLVLGYCRVSHVSQCEDRQIKQLEEYGVEKIFAEKISGKDTNRPKLQEMLTFARSGDKIVVVDFSRLARNTLNLLSIAELLENKGVTLVSLKENIDTSSSIGKFFLSVTASVHELQRACILENQREGIECAKLRGVYKGRKPIEVKDFDIYYDEYMSRKISKGKLAKKLGISRPTLNRLFEEYKEQQPELKPV